MVHCVDDQIGRIVAALEKKGLRQNTLIAFSSDNGGPLGAGATNGPWRAGKGTLYEGGVRVSAFANWPGKIKPSSTVNAALHIVDWYPTLLNLAGASLEQKLPLDGRDAWPAIAQGQSSPHEEILLNTTPGNGAIRIGDWKLVLNGNRPEDGAPGPAASGQAEPKKGKKKQAAAGAGPVELFNLAQDPSEKTNLAEQQPEKTAQLKARLDFYANAALPPKSAPKASDFPTPKVWGEPQ
jgi:arylsulfatase A-like enzyme